MSRCLTLEKYLEEFVDENTQSDAEDVKLIVTDQQAQTLGYFLINGLAGFVECTRLQTRSGTACAPIGGENDSEMGVFSGAAEGLRLANLSSFFDDYVPFGLEAGVIDDTRSTAVALQRNRP